MVGIYFRRIKKIKFENHKNFIAYNKQITNLFLESPLTWLMNRSENNQLSCSYKQVLQFEQ